MTERPQGRTRSLLVVALLVGVCVLDVMLLDFKERWRLKHQYSYAIPGSVKPSPQGFQPDSVVLKIRPEQQRGFDKHIELSKILSAIPRLENDFVKGTLFYNNKEYSVAVRLKGDAIDHFEHGYSYRVNLKKQDRVWGTRKINLQHPVTRHYLFEYAFIRSAQALDILAPRHEFVRYRFNDEPEKTYLMIEHFTKFLLERQRRREGNILKFDDSDMLGGGRLKELRFGKNVTLRNNPKTAPLLFFGSDKSRTGVLKQQAELARASFDEFRQGRRRASEIFDCERVGHWIALSQLFGAWHGLIWINNRFYYNPVMGRFEPFAWDGDSFQRRTELFEKWKRRVRGHWTRKRFLEDPVINRAFQKARARLVSKAFLGHLGKTIIPELEQRAALFQKDPLFRERMNTWLQIGFIDTHARWMRSQLNAELKVEAWTGTLPADGSQPARQFLFLQSSDERALELRSVTLSDSTKRKAVVDSGQEPWTLAPVPEIEEMPPSVFGLSKDFFAKPAQARGVLYQWAGERPLKAVTVSVAGLEQGLRELSVKRVAGVDGQWRIADRHDLSVTASSLKKARSRPKWPSSWRLEMRNERRFVVVPAGDHAVTEDVLLEPGWPLYVEAGARLNMAPGVVLLVQDQLIVRGQAGKPVVMTASRGRWQGLVVMSAPGLSVVEHAQFSKVGAAEGLVGPSRRAWFQTGGVNFVESDLLMRHVHFEDFTTEDALNVFRAKLRFESVSFRKVRSDAFDGDFVEGQVTDFRATEIGGDGFDVSGSRIVLSRAIVEDAADKAVSVGENSVLELKDLKVKGGRFGLVAKDGSRVTASGLSCRDTAIAVAAYVKKPEYPSPRMAIEKLTLQGGSFPHMVQKGARVILEGRRLPSRRFNVRKLYP